MDDSAVENPLSYNHDSIEDIPPSYHFQSPSLEWNSRKVIDSESPVCYTSIHFWWHKKFAQLESFCCRHQWKVLCSGLLLGLFCLGLKLIAVDTDFESLWIPGNSRIVSEWRFVTGILERTGLFALYPDKQTYQRDSRPFRLPADSASSNSAPSSSNSGLTANLPGREYMGTMEAVIQTVTVQEHPDFSPQSILTPSALLDHMEFLAKVRRLQITVGNSKWSFKDLCQRSTLPFTAGMHHIQAYLDMIIPCTIITPLDCFWEGSKVLGPEESMWIPWFGDRNLLQWTNIDPVGILHELKSRYGNHSHSDIDSLIQLFKDTGIDHGYLNRTCLDPTDPACPSSSPNYHGLPPDVALTLTRGCPGFASKVLHWPLELIVGGRSFGIGVQPNLTVGADELIGANSLQSLILLRSPRDLFEAVRLSDPYKHESWTLADAQHVLDAWRRNLRRLVSEHNIALQAPNPWTFYTFTDNSLRDLFREVTFRLEPVKIIGCVLLVTLYGLVCLLDWRDPIRSQCWLILCGMFLTAISTIAGLGICAALGLSFNLLTIQVMPFLMMGLGAHSVFAMTTCYHCGLLRQMTTLKPPQKSSPPLAPWPSATSVVSYLSTSIDSGSSSSASHSVPILAEHGPSLLFGSVSISGAFFCASYIPVPLMRQFCLQAGTLSLLQALSLIFIFPALLKLDEMRRLSGRLDVFCCLKQHSIQNEGPRVCQTRLRRSLTIDLPPNRYDSPSGRTYSRTYTSENSNAEYHSDRSANFTQPAIKVKVVNHLVSASNPPIHPSDSRHPSSTIHTTVTVSGAPVETTSNPPTDIPDVQCRGQSVACQGRSSKVNHSPMSPADPLKPRDMHTYGRFIRKSSLISTGGYHPCPISVRIARRLALTITKHWTIQLLICLIGLLFFFTTAVLSARCLHLGLDWSTLVPWDTVEYGFTQTSRRDFGLQTFQIIARGSEMTPFPNSADQTTYFRTTLNSPVSNVTTGFQSRSSVTSAVIGRGIDFPMQQRQLHRLYDQLSTLPRVVLAGRGNWLRTMREWLQHVQQSFDSDRRRGLISNNGHWSSNASKLGILGLHLIVQTDRGPELSRIGSARLVRNGIIDPPAFYTLLHVWRSYDALNFSALACTIYPEPSIINLDYLLNPMVRSGRPSDLSVFPPTEPIEFVQTNFYAIGVNGSQSQLKLAQDVRFLTETMTAQGVPVFPVGESFTLAENFFYIGRETSIALGIFFALILVVSLVLFSSPVVSLLLVVFGAGGGLCAALCGFCLLGLDLNPVSATLLLFSSAWGARISIGFLSCWPTAHYNWSTSVRERQTRRVESEPVTPSTVKLKTRTVESPSDHRSPLVQDFSHSQRFGSITKCDLRQQIVCTMINHGATMFHSTIGLILAVALLAAGRVQFIVHHFFWLTSFVSVICLFISSCVIPALCCLFYPLDEFLGLTHPPRSESQRIVGRRKEPYSYPAPSMLRHSDSGGRIEAATLSVPLTTTAITSTVSTTKSHSECPRESRNRESQFRNPNMDLLDLCKRQLKSFPDEYTAALVVAVATAATANAVRSRPASLSTISEEPSHSNSTLSLNRPNLSNSSNSTQSDHNSNSESPIRNNRSDIDPTSVLYVLRALNLPRSLNGANNVTHVNQLRGVAIAGEHFDTSPPPPYRSLVHEACTSALQRDPSATCISAPEAPTVYPRTASLRSQPAPPPHAEHFRNTTPVFSTATHPTSSETTNYVRVTSDNRRRSHDIRVMKEHADATRPD